MGLIDYAQMNDMNVKPAWDLNPNLLLCDRLGKCLPEFSIINVKIPILHIYMAKGPLSTDFHQIYFPFVPTDLQYHICIYTVQPNKFLHADTLLENEHSISQSSGNVNMLD